MNTKDILRTERKRYNPVDSNFRRQMYDLSKILFLLVSSVIYLLSLHLPFITLLEEETRDSLADYKQSNSLFLTPVTQNILQEEAIIYSMSLKGESSDFNPLSSLITADKRVVAMRDFLNDYNSPMAPYAEKFVTEADKYGLDWRLVVAISGVESAFGLYIPPGSYNAWGWKGDRTREWSHFRDWNEAIEVITAGLALGYGITLTPFDIEPTYCPPCGRTEGHPWANGVTRFMNEMQLYSENI